MKVRPRCVVGDEGYTSGMIRAWLRRRGIKAVISQLASERKRRRFDKEIYRERNVVERLMNRLKRWRRVATRYEKRVANYQTMVPLAAIDGVLALTLQTRTKTSCLRTVSIPHGDWSHCRTELSGCTISIQYFSVSPIDPFMHRPDHLSSRGAVSSVRRTRGRLSHQLGERTLDLPPGRREGVPDAVAFPHESRAQESRFIARRFRIAQRCGGSEAG